MLTLAPVEAPVGGDPGFHSGLFSSGQRPAEDHLHFDGAGADLPLPFTGNLTVDEEQPHGEGPALRHRLEQTGEIQHIPTGAIPNDVLVEQLKQLHRRSP